MDPFEIEQQLRSTFTYAFCTFNTQQYGASVVELQGVCTNLRRVCKEMGITFKPCQISEYTTGEYMDQKTFLKAIDEGFLSHVNVTNAECIEIERFMWQTLCRDHYLLLKSTISHLSEDDAFIMWRIFNRLSVDAKVGEAEIATIVDRFVESVGVRINGFIRARRQSIGGGVQFFPMLERICCSISETVEDKVISAIVRKVADEVLGQVIKCGTLSKKGHLRHSWKDRYCVLKPGVLRYYTDDTCADQKGAICINGTSRIEPMESKSSHHFKFLLGCGKTGKVFEIDAPTEIDRVEWIQAIKSVTKSDGKCPIQVEISSRKRGDTLWSGSPQLNLRDDISKKLVTGQQSFDSNKYSSSDSDSENEVFVNERSVSITSQAELDAKIKQIQEQHEKLKMGLANLEQGYRRDKKNHVSA
ncbi:switch-associated protein 70-like [Dysidea avara]|uniref:switch-associated protein 70-like n=1 Tax=Dysidea avara TaxID=196820 RepID=UPI0033331C0D